MTITLRATKGSALTQAELDANFTDLAARSAGFRNVLINAGFTVNQRAYASAATLASGAYGHDRWKAGASGGDYSFTQLASNTQITIASNKTLIQVIEDKNVQATSYVLSWTGTALARYAVNSATPAGSYAASPIVITGQTVGTVMSIEFGNGASAGTLGTVQLEAGAVATSFERRPYSVELDMCKRYYKRFGAGLYMVTMSGASWGFINTDTSGMRATPTVTTNLTDASYGTGANQWAFYQAGNTSAAKTGTVGLAAYSFAPIGGVYFATATWSVPPNVASLLGDRYMDASAEL